MNVFAGARGAERPFGKSIRRDLHEDHAQALGAVRQDRQSVNQCRHLARRQGEGVAALRLREQAGNGPRRVQHPPRQGV